MTTATHNLLEKLLALPDIEREEVVGRLIESLNGPPGPDEDDPAFIAELTRRADRAMSGESKGTDWRIVHEQLRGELEQR